MANKKSLTPRVFDQANCIMDFLNVPASKYPDKAAYIYNHNKQYISVTFKELQELCNALSNGLYKLGLEKAHIAVIGDKCVEWIASYLAVVNTGAVIVPIDKETDKEQLNGFLEFADCSAVIYTDSFSKHFEETADSMPFMKYFIRINRDIPTNMIVKNADFKNERFINFENAVYPVASCENVQYECNVEKMSTILFTSGTTGSSKAVMLSQKSICFCVNQSLKFVDINVDDTLLSILPLHHTYEMAAGILGAMMAGSTVCLNNRITALLSDMKYYRPTIIAVVPLVVNTMYNRIIETASKQGKLKILEMARKISSGLLKVGIDARKKLFSSVLEAFGGRLETLVCGGAALSPDMVRNFAAFGINVQQGYGITECSPVIGILPFDHIIPESCAKPLPGVQVFIDKEHADDPHGEICVKGDNVMLGYYKNPEATAQVLNDRKWFATGDLGYMDKEGFLYITGRKKNTIVLKNGKNVTPEEIEEYIAKIPYTSDCMVTLRESDNGDEKITAIIYPNYTCANENGLTDITALKEYFVDKISVINKSLASYKHIRSVEIRKNPFPKTSTQKIQRHKVTKEEN